MKFSSALVGTASIVIAALAWADLPRTPLPPGVHADRIVIDKSTRHMSVYSHGALLRSYRVALGRGDPGAKLWQGDRRTPEGRYTVDGHNPSSAFHRALHVSYPSAVDVARATAAGHAPGGDIMIHGLPNGFGWIGRVQRLSDWTAGCIALTNPEMDELYRIVPDGTPIEIRS
ncbi:MAG: L,D-transpeptidase family protein [Nevskia sp.]|nr:L,D-transpeptidase family protein [Nevskia sp.]